jgi:GMP synthase-like glutamine amidotransferase
MRKREVQKLLIKIFTLGIPILGICYGMQTMASQLEALVVPADKREFGFAEIRARGHSELLKGIADRTNAQDHGLLDVWMSHGDKVVELPTGFKVIASNSSTPIAGWQTKLDILWSPISSGGYAHSSRQTNTKQVYFEYL